MLQQYLQEKMIIYHYLSINEFFFYQFVHLINLFIYFLFNLLIHFIYRYVTRNNHYSSFSAFKIDSLAEYDLINNIDSTSSEMLVNLTITFLNTSSTLNMKEIISIIPLETLQGITSISHETIGSPSTKGLECAVAGSTNNDGYVELKISFDKLKVESKFTISIELKVSFDIIF